MDLVGGYFWTTSRAAPVAGAVGVAADPIASYPNTLQIATLDRYNVDQSAALGAIAEGDQILVVVAGSTGSALLRGIVQGTPVVGVDVASFGFTVAASFVAEPANRATATIFTEVASSWPEVDELAQILDLEGDAVTSWQTTLDRVMAAAITTVKGDVGDWDDLVDQPTPKHSAAALRMAELLSLRPDATVESLKRDAAYRAELSGMRRRFGLA